MTFHELLHKDDKEVSLTFGKGLSVIMAFEGRDRELSITEIAERAGLNRAVTRRLVRTLEQLGFVIHERGRYQLTPRVLRLTRGFLETRSIPQVIQPVLRKTSEDIGESVSFAMRDGEEAVYVAHAFVPSRFSLNMVTVGSRVPLAPTAVGRAILGFLDAPERRAILDRLGLTAYTANTNVERAALEEELGAIRGSGFSFSAGEFVEGVNSLAVPVFGHSNEVVGALAIIFPQELHTGTQQRERLTEQLKACAIHVGSVF